MKWPWSVFGTAPQALYRNAATALTLEQTAVDRRFDMPFRPTFSYAGGFINPEHAAFATCPTRHGMIDVGIDGWLLPADALKLYEMAYFCGGDCLNSARFVVCPHRCCCAHPLPQG